MNLLDLRRHQSEAYRTATDSVPQEPSLQDATIDDAPDIHRLIQMYLEEGHLLPRTLAEIARHAERFLVVSEPGAVIACAELAHLSRDVAEIRSLVVDRAARHLGLGHLMVNELARRARGEGFSQLCAFTHSPGYFARLGFSIVPHTWLPEKIATDCRVCPLFRRCGQFAMLRDLDDRSFGFGRRRVLRG